MKTFQEKLDEDIKYVTQNFVSSMAYIIQVLTINSKTTYMNMTTETYLYRIIPVLIPVTAHTDLIFESIMADPDFNMFDEYTKQLLKVSVKSVLEKHKLNFEKEVSKYDIGETHITSSHTHS